MIADTTEYAIRTSAVEPVFTHNITAVREHCLGALHPVAATGLPTLAGKGYQGAGIGVHHPVKGHDLGAEICAYNDLLTGMRAFGERANALLTQC